jgi:hypothetical protein
LHGLLVQLVVESDDAAVGLLQLVGELVVERHHAAVGLLQLGVEPGQVVALGAHLVQGRDELLVLHRQLVERGPGHVAGQLRADVVHTGGAQDRRARRDSTRHPDDRTDLAIPYLHRVDQASDLFQLRGEPGCVAGHRVFHLHPQCRYPVGRRGELHVCFASRGDQQPADLAERGGEAGLVLRLEPEDPRDLTAELPDGEDVLLDADPGTDERIGRGHGSACGSVPSVMGVAPRGCRRRHAGCRHRAAPSPR